MDAFQFHFRVLLITVKNGQLPKCQLAKNISHSFLVILCPVACIIKLLQS